VQINSIERQVMANNKKSITFSTKTH